MDFLDPKKQKAHLIRLIIGYILVGLALILTTVILLYQAYGFGIKDGEVIQNGLVFVSTRPRPADIYVNGAQRNETTNTRLLLPAGHYTFKMKREGYRVWQRSVNVEGGAVLRYDYPALFPTKLTTAAVHPYDAAPGLTTQSPDRRWVLVQDPTDYHVFGLYDLDNPAKDPITLTIPPAMFKNPQGVHNWELVEWSSDNRHVLLRHLAVNNNTQSSEYMLVDRQDAQSTVNLTAKLGTNPAQIRLRDGKYDKYYLYDAPVETLKTATLDQPSPAPLLDHVLAFEIHDNNRILYATDLNVPAGKALIRLRDGDQTHDIRQVSSGSQYLLDIAQYSGDWYVIAGASADGRTYIYRNPVSARHAHPDDPLVPVQVFKVAGANYVSFSDNSRFMMAENGQQFAIYDAETDKGYSYKQPKPLDAPQAHAVWMDGHRMMYVSNSRVYVFEYDNANRETLSLALPGYTPFFDPKYRALYAVNTHTAKATDAAVKTTFTLDSTALLLPKDQ